VAKFVTFARAHLERGQRLETIEDARPKCAPRSIAPAFLGLARWSPSSSRDRGRDGARRHSARHLDGSAVMRCLGASQRTLVAVHLGELLCSADRMHRRRGDAVRAAMGIGDGLQRELDMSIPAASIVPALQDSRRPRGAARVRRAAGAALRACRAARAARDWIPTEPSAWIVAHRGLAGSPPAVVEGRLADLATAMLGRHRRDPGGARLLAWLLILVVRAVRTRLRGSLALRPRQRRTPCRDRGRADFRAGPGSDGAAAAHLRAHRPARSLAASLRETRRTASSSTCSRTSCSRCASSSCAGPAAPTLYPMVRARLLSQNGRP
jgi:putative ABC transport system permease protein